MLKTTDAMTARKSFGALLNQTYYQNQTTIISRANKAMAALISIELLASIHSYSESLKAQIQQVAKKNDLSETAALDLANEAKEFARKSA